MKILIDIGHPAHIHLFHFFAKINIEKGNQVLFTIRNKEFELQLLRSFGFQFISFGKHYKNKSGKLWGLLKFDLNMIWVCLRWKPDVLLSHGSMYAAQVAWFLGKPNISMEDSGNMEQIKFYLPFTKVVLTPNVLSEQLGSKQIKYRGYHELAYLLPKYFTPSDSIYKYLGLKKDQKYCILRFVSWQATHDIGQGGLTLAEKKNLVKYLVRKKILVFISSEKNDLPYTLQQFAIKIPPEMMHDALAYATIYIGEGATMASEAGVLGTPSLYISTIIRCYNIDQEKYGTVFNFKSFNSVTEKIEEILSIPNLKEEWHKRRDIMLKDKIDVTAFLVWFVENYPESVRIMKENPDYQYNFM